MQNVENNKCSKSTSKFEVGTYQKEYTLLYNFFTFYCLMCLFDNKLIILFDIYITLLLMSKICIFKIYRLAPRKQNTYVIEFYLSYNLHLDAVYLGTKKI